MNASEPAAGRAPSSSDCGRLEGEEAGSRAGTFAGRGDEQVPPGLEENEALD